jgi:hypothetical protein
MNSLLNKFLKHIFNGFSTRKIKFLNDPKFTLYISISFTTKEKSLQNSTHNLSFEVYF